MRRAVIVLSLLVALAAPPPVSAHAPASVSGFEFPESVFWDGAAGSFYVTNFGGQTIDPNGRDPDGYISRLNGEGRPVAPRWVTGLRSPKGMRRLGDFLYVADAGQLVVVNIPAAAIDHTIDLDAIGAKFPNDVAVDEPTGDVYVSDTRRNAIYRLPAGSRTPEVFLESRALESPNGLLVDGGRLMVAAWDPGRVLVVDLASKAVAPHAGMSPFGQLDGIEQLRDAYLVTDNPGGRLVLVAADGTVTELAKDIPGAADLGLRPGDRVAAIPQLHSGTVRFLTVP